MFGHIERIYEGKPTKRNYISEEDRWSEEVKELVEKKGSNFEENKRRARDRSNMKAIACEEERGR